MASTEDMFGAYQAIKFPLNVDSSIKIAVGMLILMLAPIWGPIAGIFLILAACNLLGEYIIKIIVTDASVWIEKQRVEYRGSSIKGTKDE